MPPPRRRKDSLSNTRDDRGVARRVALLPGFATATVRQADAVLTKALKRVKNVGALERDRPKIRQKPVEVLEPEEAKAALASLEGHYLWPIAFTALHTGMRRGELLGLCWKNDNLDAGSIHVAGSLEQTRAGLRLKEPKTKAGKRKISIDADTAVMLRKLKVETMEQRMICGVSGKLDDVPVFSFLGELIPPDRVGQVWRTNAKVKATFHALRHTHASMFDSRGGRCSHCVEADWARQSGNHPKRLRASHAGQRRTRSRRDSGGAEVMGADISVRVAIRLRFRYSFSRETPANPWIS